MSYSRSTLSLVTVLLVLVVLGVAVAWRLLARDAAEAGRGAATATETVGRDGLTATDAFSAATATPVRGAARSRSC